MFPLLYWREMPLSIAKARAKIVYELQTSAGAGIAQWLERRTRA